MVKQHKHYNDINDDDNDDDADAVAFQRVKKCILGKRIAK